MKKILLTLAGCIALSLGSYAQLNETFETTTGSALPAGWTQTVAVGTPNDTVGWNTGTSATLMPTPTYFDVPAHTRYVCVNDETKAGSNNSNSNLMTPAMTLTAGTSYWLSFDCSYLKDTYGGITEAATVDISEDGGAFTTISTLASNVDYWWEPRYIDLSSHAGHSVVIRFHYADNSGWIDGLALDNIKVFTPATNDIALTGIGPATGSSASYALGGSNVNVIGSVFNNGSTPITSYNVVYQFNGGTPVSSTISGSIAPFTTATFTCTTPVTMPAAVGSYSLRAVAMLTGDANALNDTSVVDTLNTVAFMPHKVLAFEEGTGTWCQWCPRGAVYMDSLHFLHGDDVSLVAVHDRASDPMQVPAYDAYVSSQISGYPSVLVDRSLSIDPLDLLDAYDALHNNFAFADITVTPTFTGSSLSAAISVKPALNINGAKIALVVTEDSVHGTASGYAQVNAYSGNPTSSLSGFGANFNSLPNPIPAATMYYNHVARSIDPAVTGGALLPASMVASTTYTCTATSTLNSAWVANKLHGVVLLLGADGSVLNSKSFTKTTGVSNVAAGIENVVVFPNPATAQATVLFDMTSSASVQVEVYDMMGRNVYTAPAKETGIGTQRISIPLDNFTTGIYNVRINTGSGMITAKFNVVK